MPQLYPDGMRDIAIGRAEERGSIHTPPEEDFNTEAMQGSMQQFLSENLGEYVVIEFLIGTQTITRKEGVLYAVGRSVVTLYEELNQTVVVWDIFSVKFVTFYMPGQRPGSVLPAEEVTPPVQMPSGGRSAGGNRGYRSMGGR